jgi:hypothetical protein
LTLDFAVADIRPNVVQHYMSIAYSVRLPQIGSLRPGTVGGRRKSFRDNGLWPDPTQSLRRVRSYFTPVFYTPHCNQRRKRYT